MTTYYLYVKVHNSTGLKYLGQTTRSDYHEYPGSGKYWKYHLKKHGLDYSTTLILECKSKELLRFWGQYFSREWNVVEDPNWANLMEESGDGGAPGRKFTEEHRSRLSESLKGKNTTKGRIPWNKGLVDVFSEESRRRMSESHKNCSQETRDKISNGNRGKKRSDDTKRKMSLSRKGKPIHKLRGRQFTEEHRQKLRESRLGKSSGMKGRKISDQHKKILSDRMKTNNPSWKRQP